MKTKLPVFILAGGAAGAIIVFISSIQVNQIPTSLFRALIAFTAGGITGCIFYEVFKLIRLDLPPSESVEQSYQPEETDEFITREAEDPQINEAKVRQTGEYVKDLMNN